MSKVDWSLAPEGATHFYQGSFEYSPHWRKDGYFCVTDFEKEGWKEDHYQIHISRYVAREQPQPKPWSGPEDGLPPVGTVCEHKRVHEWQQVEVFAVKPNYNGSNTALFTYGNGCWGGCAEPSFFRAILTPEQLRESAIRELMDIAQVDCRVTAARLVDAGFKREVV